MKITIMLGFFLLISGDIFTKVLILVPVYNHPEFIVLQHKTLAKFLKDDFEMVVFNDSRNENMRDQIKLACKNIGVSCIRIPQKIHTVPYLPRPVGGLWLPNCPSARNCDVVQFALDKVGFKHNDIVVLFESDIFLIKEFSFREYLKGAELAGFNRAVEYPECIKEGVQFFWIGLILLDMRTLPNKETFNVNCGLINGVEVDSGGFTHFYLKENPETKTNFFDKRYAERFICGDCKKNKTYRCKHNTDILQNAGFVQKTINFLQEVPIDWGSGSIGTRRNVEFFVDNHFVHFYGASEYTTYSSYCDIKQFYKDKVQAFENFINELLEQ